MLRLLASGPILYIDPGTGSMLFSILIGVLGAAYYFFRSAFIKLKYSVSNNKTEVKSASRLDYAIFSDDKRYWNIFKPICEEFEARQVELTYFTASEDDPVLNQDFQYVHAEYLGPGNRAFTRLNMLNAVIVLSTTPSLDVYQWKRSKDAQFYVHIAHMPNDISAYEMFGLDHYDAILLSGEYQIRQIRELERLRNLPEKECVLVGLPYMDDLKRQLDAAPPKHSERKTVLLAPSWGKNGILRKYGSKMLDALIGTGYDIVVRPHPQSWSSEKSMMEALMEKYPDSEHFHWNRDTSNFEVLRCSDVLISDFSGVIFDYTLVFDKPVIYTDISAFDKSAWDAAWIDEELWTFQVLPKLGEQLEDDRLDHIKEVIDRVTDEPKYQIARDTARSETWVYAGEGARRTADYLIAKHTALTGAFSGQEESDLK